MADLRSAGPSGPVRMIDTVRKASDVPFDYGNSISIPAVVHMIDGKATVVRLDPRDPNFHLFYGLIPIAPTMRKTG